jgi:hypothetical protein
MIRLKRRENNKNISLLLNRLRWTRIAQKTTTTTLYDCQERLSMGLIAQIWFILATGKRDFFSLSLTLKGAWRRVCQEHHHQECRDEDSKNQI